MKRFITFLLLLGPFLCAIPIAFLMITWEMSEHMKEAIQDWIHK